MSSVITRVLMSEREVSQSQRGTTEAEICMGAIAGFEDERSHETRNVGSP